MTKKNILIITNDAGGAEIFAALVEAEKKNFNFKICLKKNSPATQIFTKKGMNKDLIFINRWATVKKIVKHSFDYVFYNRGWQDGFWQYLRLEQPSINLIVFLDHWTGWRERFGYPHAGWRRHLPNLVAVGDRRAAALAKQYGFEKVLKIKNYYLSNISQRQNQPLTEKSSQLLYASSVVKCYRLSNYGQDKKRKIELKNLLFLTANWAAIKKTFKLKKMVIRLHPSADYRLYSQWLKTKLRFPGIVLEPAASRSLENSIKNSGLVVGVDTMALLLAMLMKVSCLSLGEHYRNLKLPLSRKLCLDQRKNFLRLKSGQLTAQLPSHFFFSNNLNNLLQQYENRRHH